MHGASHSSDAGGGSDWAGASGAGLSRSHLEGAGAAASAPPMGIGAPVQAIAARLREPVELEDIAVRQVGGGKNAAYMPGERVVVTANEIFGFTSWADEIRKIEVDYCVQDEAKKWCVRRLGWALGHDSSARHSSGLPCRHPPQHSPEPAPSPLP